MLNNTSLYGFLIKHTYSNQVLHMILIIFEYYFTIFPYVLYSGKKLFYRDKTYEYTKIEKFFLIFQNIKEGSSWYSRDDVDFLYAIIAIVIGVFVGIYFLLLFFYKSKSVLDYPIKLATNFINVFFFRYFSFFFIDIIVYFFLSFITDKKGFDSITYGYFLMIAQGILYLSIYSCLTYFAVYIKIANKDIIKSQMSYPYDSYSSGYEKHLLILKILIAYEANYSFLNKNVVTNISLFYNIAIVLFSIYLEISMVLKGVFMNVNLVLIYTNFPLNLMRKFLINFNFAVSILTFLFAFRKDLLVQIVLMIVCSFYSIGITFTIWNSVERPKIYDFKDEVNEEIVVYLMSKSFNLGTKAIKNNNLSFYETIMAIVQTNHIIYCKDPSKCIICAKIKDLNVSVYDKLYFLYKYNLKNKDNGSKVHSYHQFLIKLFYSKIRNKTYKFYKYYYFLLKNKRLKVPILIQNTICFLVMDTMELENETGNIFLKVLIELSEYNKEITKLLHKLKNFIDQNSNLKTSDELLCISKDFSTKQKCLLKILNNLDENTQNAKISNNKLKRLNGKALKDYTNKKNIQSASKYNIILSRYIIETVLNSRYQNILPLNIENLDDYLSYHFSHDQMIIISTTIDENGRNKIFELVKATGFLGAVNAQVFTDFFPKKYSKIGEEKMFKTVNCNVNNVNGKFEYVIEKSKYAEHFRFDFELANTIINNKIMIYGSYYCMYENIIILKRNSNTNSSGINAEEIEVVSYSKGTTKLLLIHPKKIEKVNEIENTNIVLGDIFTHIKSKNTNNILLHEITAILNYEYLHKTYLSFVDSIKKNELENKSFSPHSFKKEEEHDMIMKIFQKRMKKIVSIKLTKMFELSKDSYVYKVNFEFLKKHQKRRKIFGHKETVEDSSSEIDDNETLARENKELSMSGVDFKNFNETTSCFTYNNSTVSSTKLSSVNSTLNKERSQATKLIKKETKKLTLVSMTIYLLNGSLVLLCIIFLCVQISQTKNLKLVNTLFFDFKTLRIYFGNLFVSVISTIKVCDSPYVNTREARCKNVFLDYLGKIQNKIEFTQYPLRDYIFYEIQSKTNTFKEYFSKFKNSLHSDQYKTFVDLLGREISFFYLSQKSERTTAEFMTISFEEELEIFISSLYTLLNSNGKTYFDEDFYFFTFEDKKYDLSNYQGRQLTEIQKELFKILSNYVYYDFSFNQGEDSIRKESESLRKTNLIFSILFMVLLAIFNFFIMVINAVNLNIATYVFKKLICSLIFRIESPVLKKYLLKKIESLIKLSEMYISEPSELIQNISKEQSIFNKEIIKKENLSNTLTETKTKDEEKLFINSVSETSYHTKVFTNQVMYPLYKRNILFFAGYYFVFLVLDVVLLVIITSVFAYQKYVVTNYDFQNLLYKAVAASHLFRILNTTEATYGDCLNEPMKETGIVNGYLTESFDYFWDFNADQKQNGFIKMTSYYKNDCDNLYETINDKIFENYSIMKKEDGKNKYEIQKKICKYFNFETFESMYFVFEEYIMIIQNLQNRFTDRTYEGLFAYINDDYLQRAYIYVYYYIRPVKQNFDVEILTPLILQKFSFYIVFVWVYLIINLVMEIILFFFNKVFIVQQLNEIHEYFFLFVQCTE